jgi:hypothetical protein
LKKYTNYILMASILVFIISLVGFFSLGAVPPQIQQEKTLVSYSQNSQFSYDIYLTPSHLYGPVPQATMPDAQYPAAVTGMIDFTYQFSPAVKTSSTSASIEAVLENPALWQKVVSLVPQTHTQGDLSLSFSLNPDQIGTLFDQIEKETGIAGSPRSLTLKADLSVDGKKSSQVLAINLDKNIIHISSNLQQINEAGKGEFAYVVKRKIVPPPPAPEIPPVHYPVEIVKSLDFTFGFTSEKAVIGKAAVDAVIENPGLWQKSVPLAASVNYDGGLLSKFNLDIESLQTQFDDIEKETKINTPVRLITIKVSIVTDQVTVVQVLPITIERYVLSIPGELNLRGDIGTGVFKYIVNLKENRIYPDQTLLPPIPPAPATITGPSYETSSGSRPVPPIATPGILETGQTPFIKLLDSMNATFSYRFKSDPTVNDLNTDVEIIAILESPDSWTKQFPLVKTSKTGNFNLTFPVDIACYAELLETIRSETGVSADSYNIMIIANLHTVGQSPYGHIDERSSPTLKGVIKSGALRWDKETAFNKAGSIKTIVLLPNPARYLGMSPGNARTVAAVLMVVFLLSSGFWLFLYVRFRSANLKAPETEITRIKRKFSQRIIEVRDENSADPGNVIIMDSIKDLLKTSDELGKPVICLNNNGHSSFYVLDGINRYQYNPGGSDQRKLS